MYPQAALYILYHVSHTFYVYNLRKDDHNVTEKTGMWVQGYDNLPQL